VPGPYRRIRSAGQLAIDVAPRLHARPAVPDRPKLVGGQAVDPVVLRVDDDGERVVRDLELDRLDAVLPAELLLLVLDRPRGGREVGLAPAEAIEAAAGAGDADGDPNAGIRPAEVLGSRGCEGADGARAVDLDGAGQVGRVGAVAVGVLRDRAAAARSDEQRDEEREWEQPHASIVLTPVARVGREAVTNW
jgi:hypothetical protein